MPITANDILSEFQRLGLDEDAGMRLLYGAEPTVISDEAIRWMDVADADVPNAVNWLRQQTPKR